MPDTLKASASRAWAWLQANPPDSVLSISDRLLVLALVGTDAYQAEQHELAAHEEDLIPICAELAEANELHLDLPGLLIIVWALERLHGQPRTQLRDLIEPTARAWARAADQAAEPMRSAARYWVREVGWWDDELAPGPEPQDPLMRAYHHTHLVYYATDYGQRPAPRHPLADSVTYLSDAPHAWRDNADLLGEALLAMLALEPRDDALCSALAAALIHTQRPDGRFPVPDAAGDYDVEHHATCVAWLALMRLIDT